MTNASSIITQVNKPGDGCSSAKSLETFTPNSEGKLKNFIPINPKLIDVGFWKVFDILKTLLFSLMEKFSSLMHVICCLENLRISNCS